MLQRTYEKQVCSVARALEVIGERWTILIIRDALIGFKRFDQFRRRLGIASNVLTARLDWLCEEGLMERRAYQERPERFEYVLTSKGRSLGPSLMMLMKWGDMYYPDPAGPPVATLHIGCGGEVNHMLRCERCGKHVDFHEVVADNHRDDLAAGSDAEDLSDSSRDAPSEPAPALQNTD